ncbi:MAG TPA: hypothetical protein ENN67_02540, partial [Firmicutes bacterium]|nr:hypothetical protein [Bacillota bacterium]
MSNRISFLITTFIIMVALGCSSSDSSPTSPKMAGMKDSSPNSAEVGHGSLIPWGVWEISIDPETGTVDIIPLRTLEFTANVVMFMQPPSSPSNKMSVAIDNVLSDLLSGYVVVDVNFTHPFPGLDQFTGFDVRGVCIGNGSNAGVNDPNIRYSGDSDLRVLNADGYTRWFNTAEFTTYEKILGFTMGKL